MTTENGMDNKTIAIIAHITLIGWIVALVMNSSNKSELVSFYIRQMLGLMILALAGSILSSVIYLVGMVISIIALVLWILSLIGAVSGEKKLVPVVGVYFQDWFKGL